MQTAEMQDRLNRLGMSAGSTDGVLGSMTRTALARFQLACALPGHNLVVDAIPGPRSWAALREATERMALSPHFGVGELRTRTRQGGPKDGTCWVHRDLLHGLERLRAHVGRPLPVVSGWRDPAHNRRVGGASASQHTFGVAPELVALSSRLSRRAHLRAGRAADIPRRYASLEEVRELELFGGLGYVRDGGVDWVTHVDVRPTNPKSPSTWRYR